MKIIHTSDWHIGQQLYGYDRTEDHRDFFRQLLEICRDEKPDALLVSGDIFDVSSPSASHMRMFTDFILELHDRIPGMSIVITSGNHDSASRIDVNRNLWRAAGIYVIGSVRREGGEYDFTDNLIKIPGKGIIMAVPFVNTAFMGSARDGEPVEKRFFKKASEDAAHINGEGLPVVLMAHLTVEGCDRKGHRDPRIGKIEGVECGIFSSDFDYVALGHIHKAQNLTDDGRIRYSGTPVAIGFDEDYPHSVSVVEVGRGVSPCIRVREVRQNRILRTFPDEAADFKTALRLLSKYPVYDRSFIRLNVSQDAPLPADCEEQATMATQDKDCSYCTIRYEYKNPVADRQVTSLSLSEFSEMNAQSLAMQYFHSRGIPQSVVDEYMEMIGEIEDELTIENTL